jgi:hypothetical protein
MNFALSDEQVLLRESARGTLSRFKTIEAAREALEDPSALPDLWPTAVEAGWPGMLVAEEHGGAGLGAFDALLVAEECGRVLAAVPLLGLLPASAVLNAASDESLPAIAAGELRPAFVPARPPGDHEPGWTVDPASGFARAAAPRAQVTGDEATLEGTVSQSRSRSTRAPTVCRSSRSSATTPPGRWPTSASRALAGAGSRSTTTYWPTRGTWRRP